MDPQEFFTGTFEVRFTTGPNRILDITIVISKYSGGPICLIADDGTIYNWENIISMKRT